MKRKTTYEYNRSNSTDAYMQDTMQTKTGIYNNGEMIYLYTYDNMYGDRTREEVNVTKNGSNETYIATYNYDLNHNLTSYKDFKSNRNSYTTAQYEYDYAGRVVKEYNGLNQSRTTSYDGAGRKVSETDFSGKIVNYTYNNLDQQIQVNAPFDGTNTMESRQVYDFNGNVVKSRVKTGANSYRETYNGYDSMNRLSYSAYNEEDGSKTYVQYGYDSTGNMTAMVNGLSALMENVNTGTVPEGAARTRYEYDFLNNMTKMIAPDGTEKTYEYDMFGNVLEEGFPDGSISYTYSAMNELLSMTGTKGTESKTYTYEYDTLGRRTQASYDGKTISNQYDQIGRMVKETENRGAGNSIVKEYSYDSAHNVETFVLKEGTNTTQSLRYNYDYLNRMVKVSKPEYALSLAEYTYDSNNNLTKESLNNGQYEVQYSYNAANLITGMVNKQLSGSQTLSSYSYTYSLDGNRLSENNKTYSYDAAGRLKAASQNGVQYSYNYDRRGNRSGMQVTANGQSMNTAYTYNQNNQLLQESKSIGVDPVSTTWYTYDARGNLLSSTVDEYSNAEAGAAAGITGAVLGESETSGAEVYEYDVFGKMEQIQKGSEKIQYSYNADGQRISKTVNSQSTEYIWDGDNIASEKTGDGPGIYYQRGLGLIASAQGEEYYRDFYFKNAHGDVTGVYYAGNNSQKASYEYDPFGKQIDPNAAGEELLSGSYQGDPNDSNPYRYAGEYYDKETRSIYLRARYYDPSYGRFTQEDPARSGNNWYVYCGNNPIIFIDPYGLDHYIYYGDEGQKRDALIFQEQLLEQDPNNPVHLIYVKNPEDFTDNWNNMGIVDGKEVSIDTVIVSLHGYPYGMVSDEGGEVDLLSLNRKNINTIMLTSCNTGNLNYKDNVAAQLAQSQNVNQVIAPDGYGTAWIAGDEVVGWSSEYVSALDNKSYDSVNREGQGYLIYQNIGGRLSVKSILKDGERFTNISDFINKAKVIGENNRQAELSKNLSLRGGIRIY